MDNPNWDYQKNMIDEVLANVRNPVRDSRQFPEVPGEH
jgi:hypothetical protein